MELLERKLSKENKKLFIGDSEPIMNLCDMKIYFAMQKVIYIVQYIVVFSIIWAILCTPIVLLGLRAQATGELLRYALAMILLAIIPCRVMFLTFDLFLPLYKKQKVKMYKKALQPGRFYFMHDKDLD